MELPSRLNHSTYRRLRLPPTVSVVRSGGTPLEQ